MTAPIPSQPERPATPLFPGRVTPPFFHSIDGIDPHANGDGK